MMDEISQRVIKIASEILDIPENKITRETQAGETAEWDSLQHTRIISETEKYFSMEFDLLEIAEFESIKDIAEAVKRCLNETD